METAIGRPAKTEEEIKQEKEAFLRKLEPYLKTGLSVNKALGEANVSSHVFYEYLGKDKDFRERINTYRNFISVLTNNIITGELLDIAARQTDKDGKKKPLTKEDKEFIWKFALSSNRTKEEFGDRKTVELIDPEAELAKLEQLLNQAGSEEIIHDND